MTPRKICIVGLDACGLLSGEGDLRYIGGETVQHVLLARAWRDLGHDVSMIVFDDGQGPKRVVDGITVIAAHRRRAGLPGLRFFHPRASKLFSALMAADADIYYQSPAGAFSGITAWFCRMAGRRFIMRIASDSDCEKEHTRIRFWRDRRLFAYALRHGAEPVTVAMRRWAQDDGTGGAVVEVRDHGTGVPVGHEGLVFDRLHKAQAARSRSVGGGAGLGLAIARDNARLLGGDVDYRRDGATTVFRTWFRG